MLTEAVLDGSQAMRDPVGGSVEFHFVPILKLISTLLIMGIFNDEDTKHILKMIDPNVFSGKEAEEEKAEEGGAAEGESEEAKEEETEEASELEDEGVGDEEEKELKDLEKAEHQDEEAEPKEEGEKEEKEGEAKGGKVDGEMAEEEKEAEAVEAEAKDEEEGLEEGLLQMKLPESVKLQVILILKHFLLFICRHLHRIHILKICVNFFLIIHLKLLFISYLLLSDVHTPAVLLRL